MSTNQLIREFADTLGVTQEEARAHIQDLIDRIFSNIPDDGVTPARIAKIPRKGDKPTIDEFVSYCSALPTQEARHILDCSLTTRNDAP